MPIKRKLLANDFRLPGFLNIFIVFFLLAIVLVAVVFSMLFNWEDPDPPTVTRLALRINHQITLAQHGTNEFHSGGNAHDLEEVLSNFDQVAGFVRAALDGGEIDGVPIESVQNQELRSEMEDVGRLVEKLKKTANSLLSLDAFSEETEGISRLLRSQFVELIKLTEHLELTSRKHFNWHLRNYKIFQFILVILTIGFFLTIVLHSRKVQSEKHRALNLMGRSEERMKLALEGANLGTWDWDLKTGELTFNQRWKEMLGIEGEVEPTLKTWEKLIHPDDLPLALHGLNAHLSGEAPRLNSEYRMWAEPGHWIWILDLGKVLERDAQGNALRAAGTLLDITHRKIIELELKREKERARKYLDLAGVMFVALDAKGAVTLINRKGCQVLGLPEEEVVGRNWIDNFVPERIKQSIQSVSNSLLEENVEDHEHVVNYIKTTDGKEVLIDWHSTALHDTDGNIIGHLSSGTDITQQYNNERSLEKYRQQLQSLAAQLAMTEDRLRQDIASGLHDSIGQNLVALKLSIDLIGLNLDGADDLKSSNLRKEISRISKNIENIVQETWSLSFQLAPPGLYESGIGSALEWLVERFSQEYQCQFVLTNNNCYFPSEKDGRGLLFQMIRELMINAVKHGSASKVDINLSWEGQSILATVTDNGSGFDTEAILTRAGDGCGFGLFSIRERLAYVSGELEIQSTIGQGTRVEICFPMEKTEL